MTTPAAAVPTGAHINSKHSRRLTLYDATDQLLDIELWLDQHADELIAAGGDIDALPELAALLDEVEGNFVARVEAVVARIHERASLQYGRMHESKRLATLAKADERAIEALKAYLVKAQRRVNYTRIEAKTCRSTVVKSSQPSLTRNVDTALPLWAIATVAHMEDGAPLTTIHAPDADTIADAAITKLDENVVARVRQQCEAIATQYGVLPLAEGQTVVGQGAAELLQFLDIEPPSRPTYRLNRVKLVERWKQRYDDAAKQLASDGEKRTPYEIDVLAQQMANADPLFAVLSVEIVQGYHLLIK